MWFCFPSQEGKPGLAGDWVGWGVGLSASWGVLRQWEQLLSLTFHWLTHPTSASGLGNTRGRSRTRLFVLSGRLKVGAAPWGRGLQEVEANISGPSTGASWILTTLPSQPCRDANPSIPFPVPLPGHSEPCLSPTAAPCPSEASSRTQNRGPVQLCFPCVS